MIWFYAQPWFLDFDIFGVNMQNLFQIHTINLSVAVWVGFLALFGIASDDGVVMATYLEQSFRDHEHDTIEHIREATYFDLNRSRLRCDGTYGNTIIWWDDYRSPDNAGGTGIVLHHSGIQIKSWYT
jgi:Cu(I)/Ag(I) efflux system membrane protein CusA/SilA